MATKAKQKETAAELEAEIQRQSQAHENFFVDEPLYPVDLEDLGLEKDLLPDDLKKLNGKFFRIAGWSASEVVALLSCIVNHWKMNKTFYLLLNKADCNEPLHEVFRLQARPTKNQPGNGIVVMRPSDRKKFPAAKKYDEITGVIAAKYENENEAKERSSERFWEDLQKLFHDNTSADSIPDVALEVYLLLLFEIARRLVRQPDQKPSGGATAGKKEALDCLPIGVAIARMLVVKPDFRKVFLKGEEFDCFSVPSAAKRRKRIINLNEAFRSHQGVRLKSKEDYLKELENAFLRPATPQVASSVTPKPCADVLDISPKTLEMYSAFDYIYYEDENGELCSGFQDLRLCEDTCYGDYDTRGEFVCVNHDYGDDENPLSVWWFCINCNKEFYSLTQYDADETECPCCWSTDVSSC